MSKWEYKVEYDPKPELLMMLGKLGWELVEVLRRKYMYKGLFEMEEDKYIFKREVKFSILENGENE